MTSITAPPSRRLRRTDASRPERPVRRRADRNESASASTATASSSDDAPKQPGRFARTAVLGATGIVALGVVLVVLFTAVFPTGEYLDQRAELADRQAELAETHAEIAAVEEALGQFNDRLSVSRIARERFSLVTEGETLYRLTTRGGDTAEIPASWLWPGFERLVRGE